MTRMVDFKGLLIARSTREIPDSNVGVCSPRLELSEKPPPPGRRGAPGSVRPKVLSACKAALETSPLFSPAFARNLTEDYKDCVVRIKIQGNNSLAAVSAIGNRLDESAIGMP